MKTHLVVEEEPTDKITTAETEDEKNDLTLQVGGKGEEEPNSQ